MMLSFKKFIFILALLISSSFTLSSVKACEEHASTKIEETTVGNIENCRVGVGNIFSEDYENKSGQTVRARRASLTLFDCNSSKKESTLRVAEGEKIKIGKKKFIVEKIHENSKGDKRGFVELREDD